MRHVIICNLLHSQPADALQLRVDHANLSDNCRYRLQTIYQIANPWEEEVQLHLMFFDVRWIRSFGLFLIQDVLCRTMPAIYRLQVCLFQSMVK